MSKTLWNTIKIEVPEKMLNITKKDSVTVKNTLTNKVIRGKIETIFEFLDTIS